MENIVIKLPEGLKDAKAPNRPDICEKIAISLRGACLQFGRYNPAGQTFEVCDEEEATQTLVIIPKDLKRSLDQGCRGRRSALDGLKIRSEFYFDEKEGKERFHLIIGYRNGEFSRGASSRAVFGAIADYCSHEREYEKT